MTNLGSAGLSKDVVDPSQFCIDLQAQVRHHLLKDQASKMASQRIFAITCMFSLSALKRLFLRQHWVLI